MKDEYNKPVVEFLKKTNTEVDIKYFKHRKHFEDYKEERDIYEVTIKRNTRQFSFRFGQSLNDSGYKLIYNYDGTESKYSWLDEVNNQVRQQPEETRLKKFKQLCMREFGSLSGFRIKEPVKPNEYDVLCCLTYYDVGDFEDFCGEFGYDTDSRKAEKIYTAVFEEYKNVCTIWNDSETEELREVAQ